MLSGFRSATKNFGGNIVPFVSSRYCGIHIGIETYPGLAEQKWQKWVRSAACGGSATPCRP